MTEPVKKGAPILGVFFLVFGLAKMVQGDDWVVWFVLGIVFGGLGVFGRFGKREGDA